jgi:predicted RND superfamily exporter protein
MAALITDAVGFAVLLVIDIGVIRELAIAASLGVGVLILSNLILLPLLLSYGWSGTAKQFRTEALDTELTESRRRTWELLVHFTSARWAKAAVEEFSKENDSTEVHFLLAAGSAGIGPTAIALVTDYLFKDDNAVRYSTLVVALPAIVIGALMLLSARSRHVALRGSLADTAPLPQSK